MVASQRQLATEDRFNRPEFGVSSVVAGRGRLVLTDLDFIDDADDVLAGVSVGVAHHHQQGWLGPNETCLFFQFPHRSVNRVFTLVNKTTGQGPRAFHRRVFSLNQEDGVTPSDSGVSSQCGVEPAVALVTGRHIIHRSGDRVPGRFEWP